MKTVETGGVTAVDRVRRAAMVVASADRVAREAIARPVVAVANAVDLARKVDVAHVLKAVVDRAVILTVANDASLVVKLRRRYRR